MKEREREAGGSAAYELAVARRQVCSRAAEFVSIRPRIGVPAPSCHPSIYRLHRALEREDGGHGNAWLHLTTLRE